MTLSEARSPAWPQALYGALKQAGIQQVSFVPDAGHAELIRLFDEDPDVVSVTLTTEEEGVALAAGAWLGGQRSVILVQSSGVGNCINMLSLSATGRFPLLLLVTMRGEWKEFNPWQVPMGQATQPTLEAMGAKVLRANAPEDVEEAVTAGAQLAFGDGQQVAVLLSQRLIGEKIW